MQILLKLQQRRQLALDAANKLHTESIRAGRQLTDSETTTFKSHLAEAKALDLEIKAAQLEVDRERTMPAAFTVGGQPPARESGNGNAEIRSKGKVGARYADLFGAPSKSDFKSADEFYQVIASGRFDPRLYAANYGSNESVPSEGGFAVPPEFASQLLDNSMLEGEIIRPRARIVPMTGSNKTIALWDAADNSTGAPYGGLALAWAAEQSLLGSEMPKLRQIELIANKAYLFSWISSELMEDGASFDQAMGKAFQKSMGWGLDLAFFEGNGAGKPLGVMYDPALIVQAKDSGQAAATITYTNLANMFSRLHPACLDNSVWVASSSAIPQLLALVIPGTTVPVVVQNTVTGEFRILTRPVVFTEKLAALGTEGDIIISDFSQYIIGLRKDVTIATSNAPGFMTDQLAFRAMVRVTGQGTWHKPFTPLNGPTTSWVVALATRS